MNITSVHHIHFNFHPRSREEIRFFYATVLGAHERHAPEKKQLLQFEMGHQLLCFTPDAGPHGRGPTQHVAFNIEGIGDLRNRLAAFDLSFIESHPEAAQAQQIYIKDPAGNQLEFLERQGRPQADAAAGDGARP
ncbi:VOC family protein [Comamonas terrae]|uniref:VOC family protein n=1 Tax=Comamonas terrae TaxID=673548 RepID=A0ABW5UQ48_9BURK|nr:VOC family protein [Comamonas terrae]